MNAPVNIDYAALIREDTPDGFLVNSRLYQDEGIFREEMDRIFHRGWVYVGHASEVPNAGDYRVRLIGHSVGRQVAVEIGRTIWKTLAITGSGGTRAFAQRTIRFMDRMRGRFDVRGLITHRFPFGQIHEAFEVAAKEKASALKVMLLFE